MAKKKIETNEDPKVTQAKTEFQKLVDRVDARDKQIDEVLENFRTSFKNLEEQIRLIKERNRLR